MEGLSAIDYVIAREVLQRGIAALYFVAFWSTLRQFPALLGERGLQPAPKLLDWAASSPSRRRRLRFTIFRYVRYTDRRLRILCVGMLVIAALLVAGVPQLGPPPVAMAAFLALWAGYRSITSLGQAFYGFGWELLLLEVGFLAAFLGSAHEPPTVFVIVLFWWLLFRLEFGAGMIKLRGGREWRDLTALTYHHETQPLPGPLSRQAHLLPRWFHKLEVLGNHFAQLIVPWLLAVPLLGYWVPGPVPAMIGTAAAAIMIATQLWLVLTGNFAWLNWATIVIAASGLAVPWASAPATVASPEIPLYWLIITGIVFAGYVWLSWPAVRNLFFPSGRQVMNGSFNRLQLANAYGAFGTVTKRRVEYVIEGTRDDDPASATWHEYEFSGKPGDTRRRPPQVAPRHLRLDWLMWFLPLGRPLEGWFTTFLGRLLEADPQTLQLLRHDPFGGERPTWIRVVAYRYRFTTRAERRETGAVWLRDERRIRKAPMRIKRR